MFETDICIYLKWLHFVHAIIVTGGVRVVIAKVMLCVHVSKGKRSISDAVIVKDFDVETYGQLPASWFWNNDFNISPSHSGAKYKKIGIAGKMTST